MEVKIIPGKEARSTVDPFYEADGRQTRARDEDLFFLALFGQEIVGSVRFCVENNTPMLRGMLIRADQRRSGIGKILLLEFSAFLEKEKIRNVFCLPYHYLENFYEGAGFRRPEPLAVPDFLQTRMSEYNQKGYGVICMVRN